MLIRLVPFRKIGEHVRDLAVQFIGRREHIGGNEFVDLFSRNFGKVILHGSRSGPGMKRCGNSGFRAIALFAQNAAVSKCVNAVDFSLLSGHSAYEFRQFPRLRAQRLELRDLTISRRVVPETLVDLGFHHEPMVSHSVKRQLPCRKRLASQSNMQHNSDMHIKLSETATDVKPVLLNEYQVAKMIGMSVASLRRWRQAGVTDGPNFIKFGNAIRYAPEDIARWIAEGRKRAEARTASDKQHPWHRKPGAYRKPVEVTEEFIDRDYCTKVDESIY